MANGRRPGELGRRYAATPAVVVYRLSGVNYFSRREF
jgi:hypothetical protein